MANNSKQPLCLAYSPDKLKRLQGFYRAFQQGGNCFTEVGKTTELNFYIN